MTNQIVIHTPTEFEYMRRAGQLAAEILLKLEGSNLLGIGHTTEEINAFCHAEIIKAGAIPAPLNYKGFPKSVCTSVNHVVCHGIPGDKILKDGDIINVDVTVILDGWHGDTSRTYCIGNVALKGRRLIQVTYNAMMAAIEKVKPGLSLREIGRTIQKYVESKGYSVVRDYCGHGIGKVFHCEPQVMHYDYPTDIILQPGMFFTIEPMVNQGKYQVGLLQDGWTVVTKDKSLSAQFEHTIGVTESGYEIFTLVSPGQTRDITLLSDDKL